MPDREWENIREGRSRAAAQPTRIGRNFRKFPRLVLLLLLFHGGNSIKKVHGGRWQATFDMRTLPETKRRPGGGQLGEEHVPEAFPNSRMTDECRHEGMNETRKKGTCPINQ